ncbi:MAG: hypothetical protein PUB13_00430 [Lachnospiraceae bacterium]|nr:hypothetical protein [Lachnospiraceae bacterium]
MRKNELLYPRKQEIIAKHWVWDEKVHHHTRQAKNLARSESKLGMRERNEYCTQQLLEQVKIFKGDKNDAETKIL